MINTMLIGIGPHAKRIYLPFFKKHGSQFKINLCLGVECKGKEQRTKDFLSQLSINIENLYFVDPFSEIMPNEVEKKLNEFVKTHKISAVIIATEPTAHKAYALWALKNNLHVLLDKPITTRKNVVYNLKEAEGIYQDYLEINEVAKKAKAHCLVNSQRRYHPGKQKVYELIKEIANNFNMPVTAIHSSDADGQWFFPEEILNETYHGYNLGNGKCSHSGYHYFDTIYNFYKFGKIASKQADHAEVYTSFLQPRGFLQQITQADYKSWFGNDYQQNFSDEELSKKFKNFGEIDAFTIIKLLKDNEVICNISLDLMHNSFCRRSWVEANKDLYKHNGRVKHEYHSIQQGPLQAIQIHGYQKNSEHDKNDLKDFAFGGNNHYEIHVFRNNKIVGGKPLVSYSTRSTDPEVNELDKNIPADQLTYEYSRELATLEFFNLVSGKIKKSISEISDHEFPVKIMSAVYQSHIKKKPVVFEIN